MSGDIRIVLTSMDDRKAAQSIARALIETGLAACVQVSAEGASWYRWQGEVQHAAECYLVVKTGAQMLEAVIAWLQEHHPYELPEIVWFSAQALPGYAAWIQDQLGER